MHVFDLFAVAEDRRLAREREGRLERMARRMARVRPEPVAGP